MKNITRLALPLLLTYAISSNAENLKSTKLRSKVCDAIIEHLEDKDLRVSYKSDWDDLIEVLPNFSESCEKSSKSFSVVENIVNERAKTSTELKVAVDFDLKNRIQVKGSVKLKRSAFDPNTGEVKLGEWKLVYPKFSFKLGKKAIKSLAEVIASTANIHNGDSQLDSFDPKKYSSKKELRKLNKDISESFDPENSCISNPAIADAEWMIKEAEDFGGATATTLSVLSFLQSQDLVLGILGNDVEEWEESCAYYDVYIYLKNGSLVKIFYDFTT